MAARQRPVVLITGCTDGTAGASLAKHFHLRGCRVFATARSVKNMESLSSLGIETLELDVTKPASIAAAVEAVRRAEGDGKGEGKLDILVNNAAYWNVMPAADQNLEDARRMFEINYIGLLGVTQAFLPLLVRTKAEAEAGKNKEEEEEGGKTKKQKPMIANVGSISTLTPGVYQGVYAATKAAVSALTDVLRMELAPFGVDVVEIQAGGLRTRFLEKEAWELPQGSMYESLRGVIERRKYMDMSRAMAPDEYGKRVVGDLLSKRGPAKVVRRGTGISVVTLFVWLGLKGLVEWLFVKQAKLGELQRPE